MSKISTLQQFRSYILTKLGSPVINVEIDQSTQLNQVIEDSVQDFCRYNYGDASYLDYYIFSAMSGVSEYSMSSENIEGVFDMSLSLGIDGINTLFSPSNSLLYSDFVRQGSIFSDSGGFGASPGLILTTYTTAMEYLEQIRQTFGKMYTVRWLSGREKFLITPTPTDDLIGVIYLYRRETAENLYNHPLLKKLCVARAKIQWGTNLKKYNVELPEGSVTINGSDIYQEGIDQEKEVLDQIKSESEPIDIIMG
jgi:hypothetical protein